MNDKKTYDKQTYFGLGSFTAIVLIATILHCAKQPRVSGPPRAVTKAERDFAADCMRYKVGSAEECRDVARDLFEGACPVPTPVLVELDKDGKPLVPDLGRAMEEREKNLP